MELTLITRLAEATDNESKIVSILLQHSPNTKAHAHKITTVLVALTGLWMKENIVFSLRWPTRRRNLSRDPMFTLFNDHELTER